MNADSAADQSGDRLERSSFWPGLLASTAAFSAYLALLGGGLLAVRFWHAGLPVAPAVSAVPFSTLITTALVELVPVVLMLGVPGGVYVMYRVSTHQEGGQRLSKKHMAMLGILAAIVGLIAPFNLYGLAVCCSIFVPVVLAERTLAPTAIRKKRVMIVTAGILAIAASMPVLARQAINPIYMERVRIERPGRSTLYADLVAIRDASIVVADCHQLIVLPTPAKMYVESLPSIAEPGEALLTKFGVPTANIVKPKPVPCWKGQR